MFQGSVALNDRRSSESSDKYLALIAKGLVSVDSGLLTNIRIAPVKPLSVEQPYPDCWIVESGKDMSTRDGQIMEAMIVRHWDDYPNVEFYDVRTVKFQHLALTVSLLLANSYFQTRPKIDLIVLTEQLDLVKHLALSIYHRVSVINPKGINLFEQDRRPDDVTRREGGGFRGAAFKDWKDQEQSRIPFSKKQKENDAPASDKSDDFVTSQEENINHEALDSLDRKISAGKEGRSGFPSSRSSVNRNVGGGHRSSPSSKEQSKNKVTPSDFSEIDEFAGES